MTSRLSCALVVVASLSPLTTHAARPMPRVNMRSTLRLCKLSVAVAEAMPADQYLFRPHPDSMDFGQLMSHLATTNYQFCAGLKDAAIPALPSPTDKDGVSRRRLTGFDLPVASGRGFTMLSCAY